MHRELVTSLLLTILVVQLCGGSSEAAFASPQNDKQELLNGIDSGTGLLRAGASDDKSLIPSIRERLHLAQRHKESKAAKEARLALAKLGFAPAQQAVHCELYSNNKFKMNEAAEGLEYIGGWFAIREAADLLDSDNRFQRSSPKDTGDIILVTPSVTALKTLSALLPDGPTKFTNVMEYGSKRISEEAALWKQWVKQHEATLKLREPVGSALDLSARACKSRPKL